MYRKKCLCDNASILFGKKYRKKYFILFGKKYHKNRIWCFAVENVYRTKVCVIITLILAPKAPITLLFLYLFHFIFIFIVCYKNK